MGGETKYYHHQNGKDELVPKAFCLPDLSNFGKDLIHKQSVL